MIMYTGIRPFLLSSIYACVLLTHSLVPFIRSFLRMISFTLDCSFLLLYYISMNRFLFDGTAVGSGRFIENNQKRVFYRRSLGQSHFQTEGIEILVIYWFSCDYFYGRIQKDQNLQSMYRVFQEIWSFQHNSEALAKLGGGKQGNSSADKVRWNLSSDEFGLEQS